MRGSVRAIVPLPTENIRSNGGRRDSRRSIPRSSKSAIASVLGREDLVLHHEAIDVCVPRECRKAWQRFAKRDRYRNPVNAVRQEVANAIGAVFTDKLLLQRVDRLYRNWIRCPAHELTQYNNRSDSQVNNPCSDRPDAVCSSVCLR